MPNGNEGAKTSQFVEHSFQPLKPTPLHPQITETNLLGMAARKAALAIKWKMPARLAFSGLLWGIYGYADTHANVHRGGG